MTAAIIDTGPLVAFLSSREAQHAWARQTFASIRPPARTCESVIAEAWHLLRRTTGGQRALLALLERKLVRVDYELQADAAAVDALVAKYANVPMSLADACLVRMAERTPQEPIVTLDPDFRIYRLSNGRAIGAILPPTTAA